MNIGRPAAVRFTLALILLLASIFLWARYQNAGIKVEEADRMATSVFTHYLEESGQPAQHFIKRKRVSRKGGWEYRWGFAPCADEGALRLFVDKRGSARLLQLPECSKEALARGYLV